MKQLFDSFARLGDVAFGIIIAFALLVLAGLVFIEIIDFLFVDPIKRAQKTPTSESQNDLDNHFDLTQED